MAARNSRPGLMRGLYLLPAGFVFTALAALLPVSVRAPLVLIGGWVVFAGLLWGIALLVMWPLGLLARRPGTPPRAGGPFLVVGAVMTVIGALLWIVTSVTSMRESNPALSAGVILLTIGLTLTTVGGWRLATKGLGATSAATATEAWPGNQPAPPPPADTPEGWYPNPNGPGRRYWDGTAWTQHTAPDAPAV